MKKLRNITLIICIIAACLMTACGTKPEQTEENTVETDTFDSYEFIPGEDYIH